MATLCTQTGSHGHRLNVLLAERNDPWTEQLPRLLEPQGVRTLQVRTVNQAVHVIEREPIHAVVVDIELPMEEGTVDRPAVEAGGLKLLRVIRRLKPAPPAVVVRGRLFDRRTDDRQLAEALRLDAFSVLDQPVHLEQVLETLRRPV